MRGMTPENLRTKKRVGLVRGNNILIVHYKGKKIRLEGGGGQRETLLKPTPIIFSNNNNYSVEYIIIVIRSDRYYQGNTTALEQFC